MPEPQASLQRKLLGTEGVEFAGVSINMKSYGWLPKAKSAGSRKSKSKGKARK
jgi:hypothetical protein